VNPGEPTDDVSRGGAAVDAEVEHADHAAERVRVAADPRQDGPRQITILAALTA
jgi:hypothetical protein